MPWDRRGYFYLSRRVGKRVTRDYFGRGPLAELAADLVAEMRRAEAAAAGRVEPLDAAAPPLRILGTWLDLAAAAHLLAAGFYRHDRGPWRRRRAD